MENKDNRLQLILNYFGLGILFWISLISLTYVFSYLLDPIIIMNINSFGLTFTITKLLNIAIFTALIIFFRRHLKKQNFENKNTFRKTLISLVLIYIVSQILQYFLSYNLLSLIGNNTDKYFDYQKFSNSFSLEMVNIFIHPFKIIIICLIFIKNVKVI